MCANMTKTQDGDANEDKSVKLQKRTTRLASSIQKPKSRPPSAPEKDDSPNENVMRIVIPQQFLQPAPQMAFPRERQEHNLSRSEEKYLSTLPPNAKKRLLSELKKSTATSQVPLRFRILQSALPNKYELMQRAATACESPKFESWIESLLSLPIGKLAPPPIRHLSDLNEFLHRTRYEMDEMVYGQHEAKDEVMRLLCQWSASGGLNTFAIGLEGPPGIGKTTFAKNVVSKVMQRPFNFISLGGATDSSHLLGHSYTYEGAIPGRIVDGLKTSRVMNPCFYFDELDKISKTPKGDEIANVLIHLTDREQNCNFHDRYFNGVDFDLSQSLFIFSYNYVQNINPVLLDRLNVIKFKTPTVEEKVEIAKNHLIPKALRASGMTDAQLCFSDKSLEYIITECTDESGVRNLEKALCRIVSTMGVMMHAPDVLTSVNVTPHMKLPMQCDVSTVKKILGEDTTSSNTYMLMYN